MTTGPRTILSDDERMILTILNHEGGLKSDEIFDLMMPIPPDEDSLEYQAWVARWNSLYDPLVALDKAGFLAEMTTTVRDEYNFGRYQITEAGQEALTASMEAGT